MFEGTDTFNEILTGYAQGAYINPDEVTDLSRILFPEVGVDEASGTYDKWDIDPAFTAVHTGLARNQTAHRIQIGRQPGHFDCEPNAIEIAHWAPSLLQKSGPRYRENAVRTLMSAQFTSRQVTAVEQFKAGIPVTDTALGQWSDADTDIISEIDTLLQHVVQGTAGRRPSTLLMGRSAWNTLRNHPKVLARTTGLAYSMMEEAFMSTLAWQGVRLIISDNYAMLGGQLTELLAGDVIVLYNEEAPGLSDLSAGKEFTLSPNGPEVLTYQDHAIYDVDVLMWSSDRQITCPASAARLVVS